MLTLFALFDFCLTLFDLILTLFDLIQVPVKTKKGPGRRHITLARKVVRLSLLTHKMNDPEAVKDMNEKEKERSLYKTRR